MSSSAGEAEACVSPEVGRIGDSFIAVTVFCLVVTPVLLVSGGFLWWKNKENVYLRRRNPTLVAFFCVPVVANMVATHFYRLSLNSNFYFASCGFSNFWFGFLGLTIFTPNTCRIINFHFRVEYHKKLMKLNNDKSSDGSSYRKNTATSSEKSFNLVSKAANRASWEYSVNLAILWILAAIVANVIYVMSTCPIRVLGWEKCEFGFVSDPIISVLSVVLVPQIVLSIYFGRLVKQAPDPFGIKKEIDGFNLFFCLIVVIIILDMFDPGNLAQEDSDKTIHFKYIALGDFVIFAFFIHAVHYQVYKAVKMRGNQALAAPFKFQEVLDNKPMRELYKQFLQYEFSVENLVAYDLMTSWKDRFSKNNQEMRKNEAKNIYRIWIDPTSSTAIGLNVGYDTTEKLRIDLESLDNYPITMFDKIISDLYRLMANDSFIRFTKSSSYKTFVGLSDPNASVAGRLSTSI